MLCYRRETARGPIYPAYVNCKLVNGCTAAQKRIKLQSGLAASFIGGFNGRGQRAMTPPKLTPINKFQERLSGACRMQENLSAARAPPRTPLGELTALPPTPPPAGGERAGCTPLSALRVSPQIRNRRLGPSHHDGLDPPMNFISNSLYSHVVAVCHCSVVCTVCD